MVVDFMKMLYQDLFFMSTHIFHLQLSLVINNIALHTFMYRFKYAFHFW